MSIIFAHYGERRDVNATDGELKIFDSLVSAFPSEQFELVRKSDGYVTAVRGERDVVRFKYTDRAKWLMFPAAELKQKKHYITSPNISPYTELIQTSLDNIKKYE